MNRVTHNNISLYAGPAHATGDHFLSGDGTKFAPTGTVEGDYYNLIFPLLRVQDASYTVNASRPNITALGAGQIIVDEVTDQTVELEFSYLQHGIINELRMGLYANFYESGKTVYGHFQRPALSGLVNRSTNSTPIANTYLTGIHSGSALDYRDCRNLFMMINNDPAEDYPEAYGQILIDDSSKKLIGFGNAYIQSYSSAASVGNFPTCSVTYIADNIEDYGSHNPAFQPIPAIDPQTGTQSAKEFAIPPFSEGENPFEYISSVVRPSDITIKYLGVDAASSIKALYGTGINPYTYSTAMAAAASSMNIQGYSLSVDLNRKPMNSIGYVNPMDRQIENPILVDLSLDILDSQDSFGVMQEDLQLNKDYYVSIQLANATGDFIDVQYDLLRIKCVNVNTNSQIGGNKAITYSFQGDISLNDYTKGMFISGSKNVYKREIEF